MKMIPTWTLNETKRAGWQVATLQWALLQFSAGTKVVARHGEEEGGGALDGAKALVRIIHFVWVFGVTSHQHTHTHTRRDNPPPFMSILDQSNAPCDRCLCLPRGSTLRGGERKRVSEWRERACRGIKGEVWGCACYYFFASSKGKLWSSSLVPFQRIHSDNFCLVL